MVTAPAPTVPATSCAECGEPVLTLHTAAGQRPITLDAAAVPSGLYRVDEQHRAARRSLVDLYVEQRAGAPTPGYEPHVCDPSSRLWYRD